MESKPGDHYLNQRGNLVSLEHFLKEVAEEMELLFSKDNVVKIVIAGPGNAKIMLTDFLPNELKNEILDLIDVDFDEAEGHLISKAEEAVQHEFAQRTGTKIEFVLVVCFASRYDYRWYKMKR